MYFSKCMCVKRDVCGCLLKQLWAPPHMNACNQTSFLCNSRTCSLATESSLYTPLTNPLKLISLLQWSSMNIVIKLFLRSHCLSEDHMVMFLTFRSYKLFPFPPPLLAPSSFLPCCTFYDFSEYWPTVSFKFYSIMFSSQEPARLCCVSRNNW